MNILNALVQIRDDIKTWVTNNINNLNTKINNKLDSDALSGAINEAITQAKESGEFDGPQSDWNQTDDTQADYIKNKPDLITSENVTELPTTNINTNKIYKLFSATFIHNRHVVDNSKCYIVDNKPTIGEPATNLERTAITAYYDLSDGEVYGYLDETLAYGFTQLAGTTITAGWYNAAQLLPIAGWHYDGVINKIDEDPNDSTIRLLLEQKVYTYQNEWIELTNSIIDKKLPIPERDGHFAYTVQRRDGVDVYELHLISHSINEAYKDGELMYPHQIPLRENGIIKTAEPKEDLDAANKKYVDTMVEDLHKKIPGLPTEGLEYELSRDGTYYTCIGIGTVTDTDIVIASEIDGKPVTSIGDRAFEDCYESLTSVVIGDSVTSIGTCAFTCCRSLTSVVIGDSVESIGDQAFDGCSSLASVVIGDSITYIGSSAFANCSSLKSIVIPDSVTSIGNHAFYWCDSLTIYCKYKENEIPEGWNAEWNYLNYYSNCPVVWGFANDFVEVDKKLTENYAPRMTKFDESWGHNRIYYIKNAQLTEEGEIPTTAELSVEVPAGKSIMVCALQDDNNESDYSYIDANGLPIEPPIEYGWEGALATPVVTINDNVASWSAVDGATHYSYLIGTPTAYNSTSNSFANTYNRVYVERTKNRGVYSRYALSSANAPVDPDPADFARNICLDSIPMRMNNGYIMSPKILATDKEALEKITERGYDLGYYLMPKSYIDSLVGMLFTLGEGGGLKHGQGAKNSGKCNLSVGVNTKASAAQASAFGDASEATAWTAFAINRNNKAKNAHSFVGGIGNESSRDGQTVLGRYAKPDANYNFLVGVGDSETNLLNGFGVMWDGRVLIGKDPTAAMHAVPKHLAEEWDATVLDESKSYADTKDTEVKDEIKSYVDTKDAEIKTYVDAALGDIVATFEAINAQINTFKGGE